LQEFDRFPEDAVLLLLNPLEYSTMNLSWPISEDGAHDARVILDDWAKLDEFIARLSDPEQDPQIDAFRAEAASARGSGRFLLFGWWRLCFERPWGIRGMENLLTDYYEHPAEIQRLHSALCDLYLGFLRRAVRELYLDGFWTSDDLGHQTQLFMRPTIFRQFRNPIMPGSVRILRSTTCIGSSIRVTITRRSWAIWLRWGSMYFTRSKSTPWTRLPWLESTATGRPF
jgi:hypothetical protein